MTMKQSLTVSEELVPCKRIFSNGSEFEWFIETQCEKCRRFRNGKCKIYNACCAAMWNEKKFPYDYLMEYEHYAGKICKLFTDKPIKRKRREHIIQGQVCLFEKEEQRNNDTLVSSFILTPNEKREQLSLSLIHKAGEVIGNIHDNPELVEDFINDK